MKRFLVFCLSALILLSGCGNKYSKEIDEVTKLEKELSDSTKDSNENEIDRNHSYYKVYEDGNVIIMTYKPFKDSDSESSQMYKLNQTSDKYEYVQHANEDKYEKSHKPVYQENNMK